MANDVDRWIYRPKSNPQAKLRLFCLPHAGGGIALFRSWAELLPAQIEVCLVQLPGRESRLQETPFDRMSPLIDALGSALVSCMERPFALYGHSMGSLLSFELARYLRRHLKLCPEYLLVSGHPAPQIFSSRSQIHDLSDGKLIQELRRRGRVSEAILSDPELMTMMMPTLRADIAVCENYVYSQDAPFECPMAVFGGVNDPETNEENLMAWQQQTTGRFSLEMLPGMHSFPHTARTALLQLISKKLNGQNASLSDAKKERSAGTGTASV